MAAGMSICYTPPQEREGDNGGPQPLAQKSQQEVSSGACLPGSEPHQYHQSGLSWTNLSWQQSYKVPQTKGTEGEFSQVTWAMGAAGDASCHPSPVCWKLTEPVLDNWMPALFFLQRKLVSRWEGLSFNNQLRTNSKGSVRVELWPKTGKQNKHP